MGVADLGVAASKQLAVKSRDRYVSVNSISVAWLPRRLDPHLVPRATGSSPDEPTSRSWQLYFSGDTI